MPPKYYKQHQQCWRMQNVISGAQMGHRVWPYKTKGRIAVCAFLTTRSVIVGCRKSLLSGAPSPGRKATLRLHWIAETPIAVAHELSGAADFVVTWFLRNRRVGRGLRAWQIGGRQSFWWGVYMFQKSFRFWNNVIKKYMFRFCCKIFGYRFVGNIEAFKCLKQLNVLN